MKYIKIFEDFNAPLNESAKEDTLADGFYSFHISKGSEVGGPPPNDPKKTFFVTHADTSDEGYGHGIEVEYHPPGKPARMKFWEKDLSPGEFDDGKARIDFRVMDLKQMTQDIEKYGNNQSFDNEPAVWAKGPEQATTKAYEILARMSHQLTSQPGEPKTLGNLIRSLFGLRKLYPEFAAKNIMFKAFLEGLEKSWQKPDFGMYKNATSSPWNKMRDDDTVRDNYLPEFRKAFADAGVIAKPATPPATPA